MKARPAAICLALMLLLNSVLFANSSARAAPAAPHPPGLPAGIITIKDGCGIGFHRLSNGVCRPQPKGPRLMRLFARKCQLGYRRNMLGRCIRE